MSKQKSRLVFFLSIFLSLIMISCAPVVISPHAQNETVVPYNRLGEVQEFGVTAAANVWLHEDEPGTMYFRTYPSASFSLFHNAYYGWRRFSGIGGLEVIWFPSKWLVPDASGFIFAFEPYAGFQYDPGNFTLRLSFAPLTLVAGVAGGEWDAGGDLNSFTFYQLTAMVHNTYPSDLNFWLGARSSPAALGPIAGVDYAFGRTAFLRAEGSFLFKPPFSVLLEDEVLDAMEGTVFYTTFGVFWRVR